MFYCGLLRTRFPNVRVIFHDRVDLDWIRMQNATKLLVLVSSFPFSAKVGDLDSLRILGLEGARWFHGCKTIWPADYDTELENSFSVC